jgi:diguanylate cyclase
MKPTDQTLLEQMRISNEDIEHRRALLSLTVADLQVLAAVKPYIERGLDQMVAEFYTHQTSVPEIALLIGDADTLARLQRAQRQYLMDLFGGNYGLEYVNNRLRIGLVHKRIGVEPKLYLAAIHTLKSLLINMLKQQLPQPEQCQMVLLALEKLFMFDITLVFETYVRSLILEVTASKEKIEQYANMLEAKTLQLEQLSRTDPLTGLLNVRHLLDELSTTLRAAQRRSEPVTVAFIDIDNFKKINDQQGHARGDEILIMVANAIKQTSRMEDRCFRYGGDEFCVILPNTTEAQARESYVQRLLKCIQQLDKELKLSIGVKQTDAAEGYISAEVLLREADRQMYIIKRATKLHD